MLRTTKQSSFSPCGCCHSILTEAKLRLVRFVAVFLAAWIRVAGWFSRGEAASSWSSRRRRLVSPSARARRRLDGPPPLFLVAVPLGSGLLRFGRRLRPFPPYAAGSRWRGARCLIGCTREIGRQGGHGENQRVGTADPFLVSLRHRARRTTPDRLLARCWPGLRLLSLVCWRCWFL